MPSDAALAVTVLVEASISTGFAAVPMPPVSAVSDML